MDFAQRLCPRCASPAGPGRFCPHCGLRLAAAAATTATADGVFHGRAEGNGHGKLRRLLVLSRPGARPPGRRAAGPAPDLLGVLAAADPAALDRARRRRQLQAGLLELARGPEPLQEAGDPWALAGVFLRSYDGRAHTQAAYAGDLADWLSWLERAGVPPFAATLATVESYSREPLSGGRPASPATVHRRLACLSHYYRRALYAGLVQRNPLEQAQRPKVPPPVATLGLSKARAQELLACARERGPRVTLLVLLLLELGLRVSEAVGADIEDLSEQGRHRVLAIRGKGQKTKAGLVPLNMALVEAIEQATAGRRHGPLLATASGRRLTRQHANKLIHHLGRRIGVPELHPHALRHAFVTLSLDEGGSLRDVQDAARHADPRTTRRYDTNRRSLERHPTHLLMPALEPWRTDTAARAAG